MGNSVNPKIKGLSRLATLVGNLRRRGKKIVLTNGCFDILHVGHLHTLQAAKKQGDILFVALNTDASVRKLKGRGRPLMPLRERAELLAALECVDFVIPFADSRPDGVIRKLRPDIHVKGGDYAPRDLPERALVERLGGRVVITRLIPERSTTKLLQRLAGMGLALMLALTILGSLNVSATAWKITKELKAEIAAKEKTVKENPYHPHARFDLGVTYGYSNKIMEGWDELKKVVELDPEYPPIALRKYERLAKKNPKDGKIQWRLGFALYFNDKKDKALQVFDKLRQENPGDIWPLAYMATIQGEKEEADRAIELLGKAIQIDSDAAILHFLLGQAYFRKGNQGAGIREIAEAFRLKALGF